MKYSIDEKNWSAYRERALSKNKFGNNALLEEEFRKIHKLMEKMISCTEERTLRVSMNALSYFFRMVFYQTGISATASNFILVEKEETNDDN